MIYALDFDGVIKDTIPFKGDVFYEIFSEIYNKEIGEFARKYHLNHPGENRFDKVRNILKSNGITDEKMVEKICDEYSNRVLKGVEKAPYIEGLDVFLEKYCKNNRCVIVSGIPQDEISHIIKTSTISEYINEIFGYPNNKSDVLKKLKKEDEVIFFGDSVRDYIAAREAGVEFIGINNSHSDVSFSNFYEVIAYLEGKL